ncbi:MAG: hypothetical protein ACP5UN_00560 [Candidatus Micrarchaeia archaeon]
MADLWDDSTDQMLSDIDGAIYSDYNIHIKELLSNPYKFVNETDILTKIDKMKADSDSYIDDLLSSLSIEKKDFDNKAASAHAVTNQLNQMIALTAKQKNIPIIKPTLFFIDQTKLDVIYIEKNDTNIISLINKIFPSTTYISDMGITYKGYNFGDWTFVTETGKNYNIKIYIPANVTFQIEQNRDKIDMLFDSAKNAVAEIISKNK